MAETEKALPYVEELTASEAKIYTLLRSAYAEALTLPDTQEKRFLLKKLAESGAIIDEMKDGRA